jgi:hypothetical protein
MIVGGRGDILNQLRVEFLFFGGALSSAGADSVERGVRGPSERQI